MRGLDPRIHDERPHMRALRKIAVVEQHHGLPGQGPAMTGERLLVPDDVFMTTNAAITLYTTAQVLRAFCFMHPAFLLT
jgi:hypothetical protein